MSVQIGDRVEVTVHVTGWGKRAHGQGRKLAQRMRGRVIWTGPRFATVELDAGYRESFWYDEIRLVGSGRKSA